MCPAARVEEASQAPSQNGSLKRKRTEAHGAPPLGLSDRHKIHDLICVGFGPASLAIAIALQDALEETSNTTLKPKVCFLEQQPEFRWHAGMMLPDAKMQISFLKDLAMQRNPRSRFTFLNYLHFKNRLAQFTNLGTFLPTRLEFADYMKWCSVAFEDVVHYGSEVIQIEPTKSQKGTGKYDLLSVHSRHGGSSGEIMTRKTRNLIIATGGRPHIPRAIPLDNPRVLHSSTYASNISTLLKTREKAYTIGILGSGQSAAEVFADLQTRYPNAHTHLIFRDSALRPSDDSPFVNEVFDSDRITPFYLQSASARISINTANKSTNYSVVRPELLDKIYHDLYQQGIVEPDPQKWKARLHPSSELIEIVDIPHNKRINVTLKSSRDSNGAHPTPQKPPMTTQTLALDALICATGYTRDMHNTLLAACRALNPSSSATSINGSDKNNGNGTETEWHVRRDYSVQLDDSVADTDSIAIYLQGCNERTHGLSDSLISVLATRAGEVVERIFGEELQLGTKIGVEEGRVEA